MANAELQDLVRRYAEGQLSRQDYRSQRGQVLDALSSNVSADENDTPTRRLRRPAGVTGAPRSPTGARLVLLGALVLLLVAIALWFLLRGEVASPPVPTQPVTTDTAAPATVLPGPATVIEQAPGHPRKPDPVTPSPAVESLPTPAPQAITLVETVEKKRKGLKTLAGALLNIKRWMPRNIDAFSNRWRALSAGKQAAARDTTWFLQLKYELYRRIAKQRARASLGNADAADQADRLVRFANELGLEAVG